jgi:hypothetical protein
VTAVELESESESRQRRYVEGDTYIEGAAPALREGTKPRGYGRGEISALGEYWCNGV